MFDVAIIGGGIIGSLIARELSKYLVNVCVLEKEADVSLGATGANSGIVHAGFDAKPGTKKALLNLKGSQMMPELCKELGIAYKNNGSIVVGFDDDDKNTLFQLLERGKQNGVASLTYLDEVQLHKKEPHLSPEIKHAIYAPTGAIVSPYCLNIASLGNAIDNGVVFKTCFAVSDIIKEKDSFIVFSEKSEQVKCRYIVNAAGVYADDIAKLMGDDSFEINPRKGEYLLLDKKVGSLFSHTIFRVPTNKGKGILLSPTIDNNLLIGPTAVDISDKEDTSVSYEGIEKIISETKKIFPEFQKNRNITTFAGLRATTKNGDFIINSPSKGFVQAAAIDSPGLTAAPAIAEEIVNMLSDRGLLLEKKESFNRYRPPAYNFKSLSDEEKNKLIKEDPSYGKIICRCENISEGEIIHALRTNPKPMTVDGIKRRTRAGMGRCGSGFCLPVIMEIMAKEQNKELNNIKKSTEKSFILTEKTKRGKHE